MIAGLATSIGKPDLKVATITGSSVIIGDRDGYGTFIINNPSGNTDVTLPLAAQNPYRKIFIKKVNTGNYYTFINRQGSDTINDFWYKYTLYEIHAGIEIQSLPTAGVFSWKVIYDTPENKLVAAGYGSDRNETDTWNTATTRYVYEGNYLAYMRSTLLAHHTSATDYTYGILYGANIYALDAGGSVEGGVNSSSAKYSPNGNHVYRFASDPGFAYVTRGSSSRFGVSTYRLATPGNHATDRSGRIILVRYNN